jgi:NADH-quinone oxidoreductase subunit C
MTDLRRILTDYGFRGYPFRKDFRSPATRRCAIRGGEARGVRPVRLAQDFRSFDFLSPWEGAEIFCR